MNDAAVVARIRGGDPTAWTEVVDAYGDRLYRSACLLSGNPADAEDWVQETLLQAAKSLGRFRGEAALSTWLHAILFNVARRARRQSARMVSTETTAVEQTTPAEQGDRLDDEVVAAALLAALRQLSTEHREVVVLRYYEQLPVQEIARRTGVGKGTVKSRLHYARQQLSVLLPPELNPFAPTDTNQ